MSFKIINLEVSGYRGIENVALNSLADTVFITGRNGNKKSTIPLALQELFIGRTFDAKGSVNSKERIITDGMDEACIIAEVESELLDGPVKLSWIQGEKGSPKFSITMSADETPWSIAHTSTKDLRKAFCDVLEINPRHLELGLTPWTYLFGSESISGLLGELIFAERDSFTVEPPEGKAGEQFTSQYGNVVFETTDQITAFGKRVYADRTKFNKQVAVITAGINQRKDVKAPLRPKSKNEHLSVDNLPAVIEVLGKLKVIRDQLNQSLGAINAAMGEMTVEQVEELKKIVDISFTSSLKKRRQLQKRGILHSEKHGKLFKAYEDAEQELCDLQSKDGALESTYDSASRDLAKIKADHDKVDEGTCPCDGACIMCDGIIPNSEKEASHAELKILEDIATEAANDLRKKLIEAQEKEEALLLKFNHAGQDYSKLDTEEQESYKKECREVGEQNETLAAELKNLNACLKAIEEHGYPEAVKDQLEMVEERIEKAEDAKTKLEIIKERNELQAEYSEHLEKGIPMYEWAVKQFHAGEMLRDMVIESGGDFVDRCNQVLKKFNYFLGIDVFKETIRLVLSSKETGFNAIPIHNISKGERALVCFAAAQAFAGQGIIVLDDTDGLDPIHRDSLFDKIKETRSEGTFFVIGASDYTDETKWEKIERFMLKIKPADVVIMNNGNSQQYENE